MRGGTPAPRRLRVVLSPFFPSNPYVETLESHLSRQPDLQVQVRGKADLAWTRKFDGEQVDVLHIHWLHLFFLRTSLLVSTRNALSFLLKIGSMKTAGIKLVWTVHNLQNHEERHSKLDAFVSHRVAFLADAIIVHSTSARSAVIEQFGVTDAEKVHVIPFGNYVGRYPNQVTVESARKKIGMGGAEFLFLFLGEIKPYKGVIELIDAFAGLQAPAARLIIAGRIHSDGFRADLERRVRNLDTVFLAPGYVPDDEIQIYMNASDVVVLPYRKVLASGILLLTMSFARACVAPDLPWIRDIIDDSGAFFFHPRDVSSLGAAMKRALAARQQLGAMGEHNRALVDGWDWSFAAGQTADLYRRLS